MEAGQVYPWLMLAAPLVYALIILVDAVKGAIIVGLFAMYASAIMLAFFPLLGLLASLSLLAVGMLLVAIGGAARAILRSIETGPAGPPS